MTDAGASARPVILTCLDYYLPGYLAGGPIRTLANVVDRLGDEFDFRIVTRDRDLGEERAYESVSPGHWMPRGTSHVMYLAPGEISMRRLIATVQQVDAQAIYLNSLFSVPFTLQMLLALRLRRMRIPVLLAPRGELAPGAFSYRTRAKRLYLRACRLLGLFDGLTWQASSPYEAADVVAALSKAGIGHTPIEIAPDLPSPVAARHSPERAKVSGRLRAVFLSRVAPVKNLLAAVEALASAGGDSQLDVYGPCEDADYWETCKRRAAERSVRMRYLGTVPPDRVASVLSSYDLFILPTFGENYGHAIVEAMQAGCPVLISDRTPWQRLAEARAGLDVSLVDPESLAAGVRQFQSMGPAEFDSWATGARAYAHRLLSDESAVCAMRDLLHLVVSRGGPTARRDANQAAGFSNTKSPHP